MKTISMEEILNLYKRCGVSDQDSKEIRTTINTGTLDNRLCSPIGLIGGNITNNVICSNNTK